MDKTKRWDPPGWPWELELLALFFVAASIVVPLLMSASATETLGTGRAVQSQMEAVFWSLAIVGVYISHLVIANASLDLLSTPFTHLFSPMIFAMVAYYRLYAMGQDLPATERIVQGNVLEALTWIALVAIATFLVARLRMARQMLRFRGMRWDMIVESPLDVTFWSLAVHFHPLVYMPRRYRVCPEGLLIIGWAYVMPIPFKAIDAISPVRNIDVAANGLFLATTTRELLVLTLVEQKEPVFISPKDHTAFMTYCEKHMQVVA